MSDNIVPNVARRGEAVQAISNNSIYFKRLKLFQTTQTGSKITEETTKGQIDGFLSQFPFKCHLPEVASVLTSDLPLRCLLGESRERGVALFSTTQTISNGLKRSQTIQTGSKTTVESTQGPKNGFSCQLPFKCHLPEEASVGD